MFVKQSLSSWKVEVDLVAPEFGLEVKRWLKKKTCEKITVRYTIHISTNLSKICFEKSILTAFWVSLLYFIAFINIFPIILAWERRFWTIFGERMCRKLQ